MEIKGSFFGSSNITIKTINGKEYKERLFRIVFKNGNYESFPEFKLKGDKCGIIDSLNMNDDVTVHFNLNGVKYNAKGTGEEKFFNEIIAWKIDSVKKEISNHGTELNNVSELEDSEVDILPF